MQDEESLGKKREIVVIQVSRNAPGARASAPLPPMMVCPGEGVQPKKGRQREGGREGGREVARQSRGKAEGEGSCRKGEATFNGLPWEIPVLPARGTGLAP